MASSAIPDSTFLAISSGLGTCSSVLPLNCGSLTSMEVTNKKLFNANTINIDKINFISKLHIYYNKYNSTKDEVTYEIFCKT